MISFLKKILIGYKKQKPSNVLITKAPYYHEDYYRQKELLPIQNIFTINRFIDEFPDIEASPNGFNDIVVRKDQQVPLISRKILFNDIFELLSLSSLKYFEKVETGYGVISDTCYNTVAFGFEHYGIFVEHEKEYVKAIWICHSPLFSPFSNTNNFRKALLALYREYQLILVDWDMEMVVNIASASRLDKYLTSVLGFTL